MIPEIRLSHQDLPFILPLLKNVEKKKPPFNQFKSFLLNGKIVKLDRKNQRANQKKCHWEKLLLESKQKNKYFNRYLQ